jgi:hypothetical protein
LDPQKERDEELLALDIVDAESCWKIYRLEEDACDQLIPLQPKLDWELTDVRGQACEI